MNRYKVMLLYEGEICTVQKKITPVTPRNKVEIIANTSTHSCDDPGGVRTAFELSCLFYSPWCCNHEALLSQAVAWFESQLRHEEASTAAAVSVILPDHYTAAFIHRQRGVAHTQACPSSLVFSASSRMSASFLRFFRLSAPSRHA